MQSENNMIPEQVSLFFYEDKHGNEVDVYGDELSLKRMQLRMMEDPEREFSATVELDQSTYNEIWKLINMNEFQQGWDMFVEACAEQEVYLRIEIRTVAYNDPKWMATSTGRFSSRHPNQGGKPQADIHTENAKKMLGDEGAAAMDDVLDIFKVAHRPKPDTGDGKKRYQKTICIDFDGVLHMYTSKWAGAGKILDGPVGGAIPWLISIIEDPRFQPVIYSSRSKDLGGIEAMKVWLHMYFDQHLGFGPGPVPTADRERSLALVGALEFPTQKPAAIMTIDDRAYRFEGRFPSLDWIDCFRPWNRRFIEADAPDPEPESEEDLGLAEEALDCLSDCLVRYEGKAPGYLTGGGNYYFEPSTRNYLAGMFRESRQKKEG